MKLLIDFDVIINTDIAVCDIIKNKYSKLVSNNIELTQDIIINRYNPNPLEIISIEDISDDTLNKIYNELISLEYSEILQKSFDTDIFSYLSLIYDIENIITTIRCKNNLEYDYIKNNTKYSKFNIIISEELDITYDFYIFKVYDYINITKLKNKKIYLPNFRFNEMFLSVGNLIYTDNDVSIINIFKNNKILKG